MADGSVTSEAIGKDPESQRKTLFVRNLPYTTTDKELEDVFSEHGPIKRSFVVKDRDSSKLCRGFGYVVFVLAEDATKALKAGISIQGRKAAVSIADKKPRKRDNYKPKPVESSGNTVDVPEALEEDLAELHKKDERTKVRQRSNDPIDEIKRTIVISGLPKTATKSKLKLLCCKFGKVKRIECPAPNRDIDTSFVVFKSIKDAVRSFQKLNRSKFDGTIVSSYLLSKEDKNHMKRSLDRSKLIVRNIAFKCTEEELKNKFKKFGEITSVDLPSKIDGQGRKRMRGFAFVQFKMIEHAKAAMDELNKSMMHGRPIIIDWAVPKDEFLSKNKESENGSKKENKEEKPSSKTVKEENERNTEDDDRSEDGDESEDDESELIGDEGIDDDVDVEKEEEEVPDGDDDSEGEEKNEDESGEEEDNDIDAAIEREILKEAKKKKSHDVKEGRTAFIRNLPFEASEEELTDLFSKYGKILYSKIVVDQETGHSRGSGFVKFEDSAALECVLADAENTDPINGGIVMEGRRLVVMKAVTRGKVMEFEKERKDSKKDPKDKRNLALAQEGVIFPNSEAAKGISDTDMKKREKAWAEKKAKLKNQNYFISRTRLCIRNLPLAIGEKELMVAIGKIVKKKSKVKKVRLMRNKERQDQTGKSRSLGYAFAEFESHECALSALRALNNNPEVFGDARRPIVEFSVENKVALELQEKRRERQMTKTGNAGFQNLKSDMGGTKEKWKGKTGNKAGKDTEKRRNRSKPYGKKRERENVESHKSEAPESKAKTQENRGNASKRRKGPKNEASRKEKSTNENRNAIANHQKPFERKKEGFGSTRKRKGNSDGDRPSKPPKMKKMKSKGKTDKDEDKFNVLVNKYKDKLFSGITNDKTSKKRWFE